ncbi:MAG: GIY-YIG nuclease family protein [Algibacter sp.]|uniref:GIY-YIG nuclease family protein n=1 Tax=Algibacter sp. TaxID=1872428 RepID=UPI00329728D1
MKNKGIIYKVTHKPSGKSYIGATTKSINERRMDHIQRANRGETGRFQEAIATYGPEAFSWAQIDSANSVNELADKEKNYIFKYDTFNNGFNLDAGGGIKKTLYQYSIKDGSLVGCYDCLTSAALAVNATKQNISMACLGTNKTCKGYYWSYSSHTSPIKFKDKRRKTVIQIELFGRTLNKFESVVEASKATGVNISSITKVCRKERKQAGGYKWEYVY